MERLAAFMKYRNIPPALQRRLRDYYAYLWENRLGYDESTVLADLPDSLRIEVAIFLRRDFIERAPLFQGASHELVREMALQLHRSSSLATLSFGPVNTVKYVLHQSRHSRNQPDGTTMPTTLTDGQFFENLPSSANPARPASALWTTVISTLDKDTSPRAHAVSRVCRPH